MTFFFWQAFSGWWKKPSKQSALTPISFRTHFVLINKLNHRYNFSQLASFLFMKDFTKTNMFAWICTHLLCSIDNRLCELISDNCQITLCTQFAQIMSGWCKPSWYTLTYYPCAHTEPSTFKILDGHWLKSQLELACMCVKMVRNKLSEICSSKTWPSAQLV